MCESWEDTSKSRIIWESLGEYGEFLKLLQSQGWFGIWQIYTEYRGFFECSGEFDKFRECRSVRESFQEFARVWGSLG